MKKEINKDTVLVLGLLMFLAIGNIISLTMICLWLSRVDLESSEPRICVPFVKESIQGDAYRMTCYTLDAYNKIYGIDIIQKPTDQL